MLTAIRLAWFGALALALAGCDGDPRPDGGAPDAGTDAGPSDAGHDAGVDAGDFDAGPCEASALPPLGTEPLVEGTTFALPVGLVQAPGDGDTFYVIEQEGRILVVRGGGVLPEPFLDIRDRVTLIGERGLLGLAFHPDYAANGRFFVYYSDGDPPMDDPAYNVLAEYHRAPGEPYRADPTEIVRLVEVTPERGNHAGGHFAFGPDGYLWGGMGDGASWGELPDAQDVTNPMGGLLRLDVDAPERGWAPPDNPFPAGYPLLWAYGLRNPWRWSFDRATGDLFIADVGQWLYEELDIVPAGTAGGMNFGWPAYEADSVHEAMYAPLVAEHRGPDYTIARNGGDPYQSAPCSVTGGYVYRGRDIPGLHGYYLYGDYCDLDVVAFRWCEGAIVGHQRVPDLRRASPGLAAFAEDLRGELYLVDNMSGAIAKIVPR